MNKIFILTGILFLGIAIMSSVMDNPDNPPIPRTGAPGELTCQASDCHRGGTFVGSVNITGLPDTVLAGKKYAITLTHISNAVRSGFELTALDGSVKKAGTLKNGTGTSIASINGKEYIRQSTPQKLTGGQASWTFEWTAPASITSGDSIKFYFVSLAASNSQDERGDNAFLGSRKVIFNRTTEVSNQNLVQKIQVYGNNQSIVIQSSELIKSIRILDLNGLEVKKIQLYQLTPEQILMPVVDGIYIVQIETQSGSKIAKKLVVN
ncbi:MAG: choice-of-anchor V domain-containing protein [Saprospiraceae bacterium]